MSIFVVTDYTSFTCAVLAGGSIPTANIPQLVVMDNFYKVTHT